MHPTHFIARNNLLFHTINPLKIMLCIRISSYLTPFAPWKYSVSRRRDWNTGWLTFFQSISLTRVKYSNPAGAPSILGGNWTPCCWMYSPIWVEKKQCILGGQGTGGAGVMLALPCLLIPFFNKTLRRSFLHFLVIIFPILKRIVHNFYRGRGKRT